MRTSRRFVHIFDRALKRHHRERAALDPGHEQYNYLRDEVASRLVERLDDIHASYAFPRAVDIGGARMNQLKSEIGSTSPQKDEFGRLIEFTGTGFKDAADRISYGAAAAPYGAAGQIISYGTASVQPKEPKARTRTRYATTLTGAKTSRPTWSRRR